MFGSCRINVTIRSNVRRRKRISRQPFYQNQEERCALTTGRILTIRYHFGKLFVDMNTVLRTAAQNQIHVCVLCDPHTRGIGVNSPTAANAVCDGLRARVKITSHFNISASAHLWPMPNSQNPRNSSLFLRFLSLLDQQNLNQIRAPILRSYFCANP